MPNSLYKYNLSNFNQIGGSIGFAPNGMPNSISANYSQTNGERKYVDSPTIFLIGDGSNLKVGKVENTASAIGATGNGKLSIDKYVGHNLENNDETKTNGGSLSLSTSSTPVSGVGINYANKDLESVTKNTIVGNVEIGKSSGDEINKDLASMTEITKDKDTKTNVFVESQTIKYALNPEAFKQDLEKAKKEIHDIYHAVDSTINPQGKETRSPIEQLGEVRQAKVILNVIDSRLQIVESQDEIAAAFEGVSKDLGYKVKIIYTNPSNSPQLIGIDKNGNKYIKDGTAYVDKDTGIGYILVNTESPANSTKAGVIGTIAEEQSHVIGKIEGRQKTVPDGSEKGLESLGRPTNDYFKNQYSKNDKAIGIKSDGRDYSNVDFGEHVGDDYYLSPEERHQFETSENAKMDDGSFIIVPKEKGDYLGDAIINDKVFYIKTDAYNYSKEGNNPKIIEELSKQAKVKSEKDPYNNYIVTVSREEGINILAVPKPKSWKENQSNDYNEAKGIVIKYHKKSKEDWRNKKYGSAILNRAISGISLLNLVQTGIGTTEAQKLYKFTPGEVQYGKVEDILARRARAQENAKGLIDNSVSAIAIAAIPNKIGGGTITIPETAQAVVATGEVVETGAGVISFTMPTAKLGGAKAMLIASSVGSNLKDSEKDNDISNEKQEKSNIKEETNKKVNDTQNLGNKNGDLYYDGRKVYTAKELNQMGRKKGGSPNKGIEYIYESPAGKPNAQEFQWGTEHSMMQNTPAGNKNVVPVLRYDNPNTRGMNFIKFDGIEVENGVTCLIDAKTNIPFWKEKAMKTVEGTLNRIRIAKSQNPGIRVIYEFPNETAAEYFRDWLKTNRNFNNIVEIRVRK